MKMNPKTDRALIHVLTLIILGLLSGLAIAASPSVEPTSKHERSISLEKVKTIIADREKIVSAQGIEQNMMLRINGINQWVSIRGSDLRNPILLVLHGGPGSPEMPAAWTFQTPWEDYFTIVEWSQRGTGKTFAANTETQMASGMNIKGMTDDAARLVQYLRERFDKKKIFLLGHSWGTVPGVKLAKEHPNWFYAYMGVGQIVNFRKNEKLGYEFALEQAKTHHNIEAIHELNAIAPYPGTNLTIKRVGVRSKWEMYYGGLAWGRRNFSWDSDTWKLSPQYDEKDLKAIDAGSLFSLEYLLPQLLKVNFDHVTKFGCPIIMFVGAHDYTTPYKLTIQWFKKIHAPSKRLVIFDNSAHMTMEEQPGRFLFHLVTDALPYAERVGDAAPGEKEIIN